jgi:hypothetical protein
MKCHCGKAQPSFNLIGLKAEYCSKCKPDEIIDIKHKNVIVVKHNHIIILMDRKQNIVENVKLM